MSVLDWIDLDRGAIPNLDCHAAIDVCEIDASSRGERIRLVKLLRQLLLFGVTAESAEISGHRGHGPHLRRICLSSCDRRSGSVGNQCDGQKYRCNEELVKHLF